MESNRLSKAVGALVNLVSRLRGPDGCPWDAQQTDTSIKMYLLEEAFEVLEAVERGGPEEVCGELGDLLFQILFLTKLAEERGEFSFVDVLEHITQKMIRRHPHVFGDVQVDGAEEVARNWARIKGEEQGQDKGNASATKSIPLSLPGLLRAHRMLERVRKDSVDEETYREIWNQVEEAFDSLRQIQAGGQQDLLGDCLGSLLFSLADFAREQGYNAEELVRRANQRFLDKCNSGEGRPSGQNPDAQGDPPTREKESLKAVDQ